MDEKLVVGYAQKIVKAYTEAKKREESAKKAADMLKEELLLLMKRHKIDRVDCEDINKYASFRTSYNYEFNIRRILSEASADKLLELDVLKVKNEEFNKLIITLPELATARKTIGDPKENVVVNPLKKA